MHILGPLHRVMTTVRDSGAGVYNVILDAGNDGVGIGDTMTNSRSGCIYIYYKFLLEADLALVTAITRATERTLKT